MEPPFFLDGKDLTVVWEVLPGLNFTNQTWLAPEATDNSGHVTVTLISGPESGDELFVGTYVVIYQAIDPYGNSANFTIYIIVLPEGTSTRFQIFKGALNV